MDRTIDVCSDLFVNSSWISTTILIYILHSRIIWINCSRHTTLMVKNAFYLVHTTLRYYIEFSKCVGQNRGHWREIHIYCRCVQLWMRRTEAHRQHACEIVRIQTFLVHVCMCKSFVSGHGAGVGIIYSAYILDTFRWRHYLLYFIIIYRDTWRKKNNFTDSYRVMI